MSFVSERSTRKPQTLLNSYRFCIDNGIMIAHAGLLAYETGYRTELQNSVCTQRFRYYLGMNGASSKTNIVLGLTKFWSNGEIRTPKFCSFNYDHKSESIDMYF